jgi:hypothetical protein
MRRYQYLSVLVGGLTPIRNPPRVLRKAGFSGPLCLEKVPGRSLKEVNVNVGKARRFMERLVMETAAGNTAASL